MSWYYNDFEYENAASRKARIAKEIAKRVKRGETFTAFEAPTGTKIVKNFWGLSWCRHLETYCGYETRLPRGRTYLRQGNVYNLKIEKGHITAEVAGSAIYNIEITIQPLPPEKWRDIRRQCEGQVASLLDLLSGKLGDSVMKIVSDPVAGIFPSRREIKHFCSCPDSADLCKHRAAVLYAVGVLFDRDPKFLFELRGTDPSELISASAAALTADPHLSATGSSDSATLADDDLSALFGIDLADAEAGIPTPATTISKPKPKPKPKPPAKSPAKSRTTVPARPPVKTPVKKKTAKASINPKASPAKAAAGTAVTKKTPAKKTARKSARKPQPPRES